MAANLIESYLSETNLMSNLHKLA